MASALAVTPCVTLATHLKKLKERELLSACFSLSVLLLVCAECFKRG